MNQIQQLKEHFSVPGVRLTALEALRKFGIARLAARIGELKEEGYVFDRSMITVTGFSGVAKVAEYVLRSAPAMAVTVAKAAQQGATL